MTAAPLHPAVTQGSIWFPYAGHLLDHHGGTVPLVVRLNNAAITIDGALVHLDQAAPDYRFSLPTWPYGDWHVLPLHAMDADRMRSAIMLCEVMLCLPAGTLSAESIRPALLAAAAGVGHTTTRYTAPRLPVIVQGL